ncbi:tRNA (adenosine(37)-N6)-threonylcarbamoyltransferase complex dimerization subunit type 1 TsaB [Gilvimarinus sp. 2_MG-2023]|uniref:tRNA (adenosine(37)-N6)-threonylcarbamoyltransferase complex dimerization subunit type 1 TsaB n=1 Tax=Gilvimarinus sp. 2_MG-2023 TaxID=3062666 RepID=UPI0026E2C820|nr:tRNA (adenosine(37)-N6)-threonylcarbamoyltransferase complex dimerization subunit type 1 TsaB [Gilvimarinus sp. 2_MG-2023]MDO6571934.1 tRNA (adenosine(37)-N6)-threonylcarbamoyltransferase complex dimerization subunit type 1 TsaB [Gilvimarinus sp. 2_MG-2023]
MPTILALDTSSEACSVALMLPTGECVETFEMAAKSHTKRVLPMVHAMLTEHGVALSDLDAIAFSAGPGSFTGIRIGMGIVQGLAFASNIPVIPVCTLQAQALTTCEAAPEQSVLSALDARMGEVYYAVFQFDPSQSALAIQSPPAVSAPASVSLPAGFNRDQSIGVGQGFTVDTMAAYVSDFNATIGPRASAVAKLAVSAWGRGQTQDVMAVEPNYIRDTVTWKKRERIRT